MPAVIAHLFVRLLLRLVRIVGRRVINPVSHTAKTAVKLPHTTRCNYDLAKLLHCDTPATLAYAAVTPLDSLSATKTPHY